jgi:hypothetical protein
MSEQMPLILDQIGERRSNIDIWKKRKKKKRKSKYIWMEQVLSIDSEKRSFFFLSLHLSAR